MENKPSFFNEKTKEYTRKKDKLIKIRIIGSIFILAGIIYLLINLFFSFDTYKSENNGNQRAGFVSLSYFGVQRTNEMNGLINSDLLREHLTELKRLGFVTIVHTHNIFALFTLLFILISNRPYLQYRIHIVNVPTSKQSF